MRFSHKNPSKLAVPGSSLCIPVLAGVRGLSVLPSGHSRVCTGSVSQRGDGPSSWEHLGLELLPCPRVGLQSPSSLEGNLGSEVITAQGYHRMRLVWVGRGLKAHPVLPSAMGRGTLHWMMVVAVKV